jgi:drug/metabolite transporter (DMT)-like permease
MALNAPLKALLQIHFCVVLWGFTAILGKLIDLPALALVWWRLAMVVVALAFIPRTWRGLRALSPRLALIYAGIGVVVTLHWLTFYGAIKLANASVAVTSLALAPVFLSLVEPLIAARAFNFRELLLGVLVVPGVLLVVGGIQAEMRLGLWVGVSSAFLVAIFGALNKRFVERADALVVTGIELLAGLVFLSFLAPFFPESSSGPRPRTWGCSWCWRWAARSCPLRNPGRAPDLERFSAQLAVNLEPVYGVGLAVLVLGEQRELGVGFYSGVAIILAAVLAYPLVIRR